MPLIDLNGLGYFKDKENAMVAPDYSASATYAVGDHVFYNGTLYKCKTAITTAEAWTSGHWETAVVYDDIAEINNSLSEIDNYIFTTEAVGTLISSVTGVEKKTGFNASDGGASIPMSQNASYDTYWWVTSEDVDLYFGSISASYFAIVVGNGAYTSSATVGSTFYIYCTNGSTRYRKSDNNLPTSASPLHVKAGYPIAITISTGKMETIYGIETVTKVKESFANEILSADEGNRTPMLQYDSTANGCLNVYIPNNVGYVKYAFLHDVSASINADIWRVDSAVHATDAFVTDYTLTTTGEWEIAIKLDGREDFSGGSAHGDEVVTAITWLVDGEPVDITTYTTMTAFHSLTIAEQSNLYDPNDSTTIFATHNSLHIFDENGLVIRQSAIFSSAVTVNTAYMAMLPLAQTVSDMLIPNSTYVPISIDNNRLYSVSDALIYKNGKAVQTRFYVTDFKFIGSNFSFLCVDNGGTDYNKCYFVNTLDSVNVTQGERWTSETHYEFIIGE